MGMVFYTHYSRILYLLRYQSIANKSLARRIWEDTQKIIQFQGKKVLKQIYDIYFVLYNILHKMRMNLDSKNVMASLWLEIMSVYEFFFLV